MSDILLIDAPTPTTERGATKLTFTKGHNQESVLDEAPERGKSFLHVQTGGTYSGNHCGAGVATQTFPEQPCEN